MKKRSLDVKTIVFSYLIFLAGWIIWSKTNKLISINEYIDWGIGLLVHIIWWPLFAIVLIKRYNDNLTVSLEEMLFTKPKLKLLIPLLAFALVYNIGVYFLDSDGFRLEMKVYDFIVTVLTVGFFEEIVFRGWFQNAISRFTGNRIGNLLASFPVHTLSFLDITWLWNYCNYYKQHHFIRTEFIIWMDFQKKPLNLARRYISFILGLAVFHNVIIYLNKMCVYLFIKKTIHYNYKTY